MSNTQIVRSFEELREVLEAKYKGTLNVLRREIILDILSFLPATGEVEHDMEYWKLRARRFEKEFGEANKEIIYLQSQLPASQPKQEEEWRKYFTPPFTYESATRIIVDANGLSVVKIYGFIDSLGESIARGLNQSPATGEWQLCPKCNGDGNLSRYNTPVVMSTTAIPICDVCGGGKIIAKPNNQIKQ